MIRRSTKVSDMTIDRRKWARSIGLIDKSGCDQLYYITSNIQFKQLYITILTMSNPLHHTPTTGNLTDANAKTLFERLKMHCKWKTCLAVSEMKFMPRKEKMALLLIVWSQTVNALKANESACFMRCKVPTSLDWDTITSALLLTSVKSGDTVSYLIIQFMNT